MIVVCCDKTASDGITVTVSVLYQSIKRIQLSMMVTTDTVSVGGIKVLQMLVRLVVSVNNASFRAISVADAHSVGCDWIVTEIGAGEARASEANNNTRQ